MNILSAQQLERERDAALKRIAKLEEHLREIVSAAEANDFDSRMKYLEAQIGREWLAEIKADLGPSP